MASKLKHSTLHYAQIHKRVVETELADMGNRDFSLISNNADPELCERFADWIEAIVEKIYLDPDHRFNSLEHWMPENSYYGIK